MSTYKIEEVKAVDASGAAQDVQVGYRPYLIQNAGETPVTFKEKDGVAATAENGFAVAAGATLPIVLTADTLSVFGGKANILFLQEG
ncbi:MAG: hypothetical protein IKM36_06290 [Oscillospiraceae bacterium]|nr:hypothetical protein [Oscillospiraceae bacterium]MBR2365910.1 hypothetical protein [Oscillospiraceae bacterium]MBR2977873.1 hypothetical protein [Oscillospiraceae bacterium]MBR3850079.1 hypothetical protein [Oscillospiraceae bacterium]